VSKLLLMASMAMMIVLPLRAARYANPKKGLKRAIYTTLLFNMAWGVVVLAVFYVLLRNPSLLFPESVNP
jgi:hypothetical protein